MNILHKAARPDRVLALLCVGWLTVVGTAQAFETAAREAFLIDFGTGSVLLEKDADQPTPPASMSKMMTIYMLFERLAEGAVSLDDSFNVSEKAWRMCGS